MLCRYFVIMSILHVLGTLIFCWTSFRCKLGRGKFVYEYVITCYSICSHRVTGKFVMGVEVGRIRVYSFFVC